MKNLTTRFAIFLILVTLLSSCINNSDSGSTTQDKKDPNPPPPPPSNVSDKALNLAVSNLTLDENSTSELNVTLDHSQLGTDPEGTTYDITAQAIDVNNKIIDNQVISFSKLQLTNGVHESDHLTMTTYGSPQIGRITLSVNNVLQLSSANFVAAKRYITLSKQSQTIVDQDQTYTLEAKYNTDLPNLMQANEKFDFQIYHNPNIAIEVQNTAMLHNKKTVVKTTSDICTFDSTHMTCNISYKIKTPGKLADGSEVKTEDILLSNSDLNQTADFTVYLCPSENSFQFQLPSYVITGTEKITPKIISCQNSIPGDTVKISRVEDSVPIQDRLLLKIENAEFNMDNGIIGQSLISIAPPLITKKNATAQIQAKTSLSELSTTANIIQNTDSQVLYFVVNTLYIKQNGGSGTAWITGKFLPDAPIEFQVEETPGLTISPMKFTLSKGKPSVQFSIVSKEDTRSDDPIIKQVKLIKNDSAILPEPLKVTMAPVSSSYAPEYVHILGTKGKHFYLTVHNEEINPTQNNILLEVPDPSLISKLQVSMLSDPNKKKSPLVECGLQAPLSRKDPAQCACASKKCVFYVHIDKYVTKDILNLIPSNDTSRFGGVISVKRSLDFRKDIALSFCPSRSYKIDTSKADLGIDALVDNTINSDPDVIVDVADLDISRNDTILDKCYKYTISNYNNQTADADNLNIINQWTTSFPLTYNGKAGKLTCKLNNMDLVNYDTSSIQCDVPGLSIQYTADTNSNGTNEYSINLN